MNWRKQGKDGRFERKHKIWSLENFNDGYVMNKGRFLVYLPDNPRSYKNGYILRSIAAYEIYHGVSVPRNMDVHHLDSNKLNDEEKNLILITHGGHSILSQETRSLESRIERVCLNCGKTFKIKKGRLNDKDHHRGRFCSLICYHKYPRSESHKSNMSKGLIESYKKRRMAKTKILLTGSGGFHR